MGFADKFASKSSAANTSHLPKAGGGIDAILEKKQQEQHNMQATSLADPSQGAAAEQNSPVDQKKASKADLIYLVKGVDDGRNAWYYVLVERLKLSLFLKALNDDIIHLENYGIILYSAYGDEPPQDITDKLKKEYDIK